MAQVDKRIEAGSKVFVKRKKEKPPTETATEEKRKTTNFIFHDFSMIYYDILKIEPK